MNYEQIKNCEERVFPYYKGVYLGSTQFGFSNIKSAKKYMNKFPAECVYEELGMTPVEYDRKNLYFCQVNAKDMDFVKTMKKPNAYYMPDLFYKIVYVKDLDNGVVDMLLSTIKENTKGDKYYSPVPTSVDDWRRTFILTYGLWPETHIDMTEYKNAEKNLIKKVYFKKGIVKVSIKFIDE